jgi:hypothetical protein
VKGENGDVNGDTGEEEWWTLWGWGLGEFRRSMAFRAADQNSSWSSAFTELDD